MKMDLLIYQNDEQKGPFDVQSLQQMVLKGEIPKDIPAWHEGLEDWKPLASLVELGEGASAKVDQAVDNLEGQINSVVAKFVTEEQDPAAVQKVVKRIEDVLTRGEEILYVGVQKKPVVTISPDSVILTTKRFIIARPKLTGFKFEDFQWRQIHDVHLSEQMMGATISCTIVGGQKAEIDSIPKKQARRIYSFAQEMEEDMVEERRNREMEEKRATAGGVVIQAPSTAASSPSTPVADDPVEQLSKLKKMLDGGLIEKEEFDSKKAEILSRM